MRGKFLILALFATAGYAATCPVSHTVASGDTLSDLGSFYFGSGDFASAILVATNARASDGFSFISNPDSLSKGATLCIPDPLEAQRNRARYATYQESVTATMTTKPWQTSSSLVTFPVDAELTVATWKRAAQPANSKEKTKEDIWVTVEPHLREFCRAYAVAHDGNQDELTQRLEQRLGLPPASGDTTFVRIRLSHATSKTIFRPCSDPATNTAHCEAAPPAEKTEYAKWFYKQYYSAFGLPRPNLYPWTSLGYTFDWARGNDGQFVRYGESEFVIPAGTEIEVLGSMSTAEYCR
jgi:hypothetical protein